jgi:hypothetical protein
MLIKMLHYKKAPLWVVSKKRLTMPKKQSINGKYIYFVPYALFMASFSFFSFFETLNSCVKAALP